MTDPTRLGVAGIRALIDSGEASAVEICRAHLDRIRAVDPVVGAYVAVHEEEALAGAARIDALRQDGSPTGPLAGVPIAVKDNHCTRGTATTCASRILERFVPPYDATSVARLREAGAVIIGKTNLDEFGMGSSTENSAVRRTCNPWSLDRVPGGSSGGSATGGSVRLPAALCGVVGMKPTYGRVSRYGLIAFASSLEQIGPLGRSVEDVARILQVIAGHDSRDATSSREEVPDYLAAVRQDVGGLRVGVPREYFPAGLDGEIDTSVRAALAAVERRGARLEEISLPHTGYAVPTYYIVATAEASSNLARYDGVVYGHRAKDAADLRSLYVNSRREGFGTEVKRRIMLGTYVLSAGYYNAYYLKAMKVRTLIRRDFEQAFEKVDVIVTPTSPTPAFRFGEKTERPLQMYLSDIFTVTLNLAGLPGVSVPCGLTGNRLPIGLQVIGRRFDEAAILRLAAAIEDEVGFNRTRPLLPLPVAGDAQP